MDSFLRKQKPRPRTTATTPPSTLTEAPRAIVRPASAASLDDRPLTTAPTTPPLLSRSPPASGALPSAPKPRKRFRKKVSGLFGDQTDLKKRMSKLLIAARAEDIAATVSDSDRLPSCRNDKVTTALSTGLSGADGIVARLEGAKAVRDIPTQAQDEFDTPEFLATARRALGSPEKLQTVRKTMGRLSPRSNERFLAELDLGTPPRLKVDADEHTAITPPDLPSVDSSELDFEREWLSSPVSVERTGAPAVLRRKARRLDRGYRSADVLRARLGGEHHRSRKRLEVFDLDVGDIRGGIQKSGTKKKPLLRDHGDLETGTDEEINSPRPPSPTREGQTLVTNDPFQMLVEVAAVEQKNSTTEGGNLALQRQCYKRKNSDETRENKRRKESRERFNS